MQTKLKGFWEKIKGFFAKLNKKTRILLGVCAAVLLLVIAGAVLLSSNKKEYEVLCTSLSASETSSVITFLSDNGVTDYRIKDDSILVPADRVNQLQIQLVTSGQMKSGYLYEFYTDNTGSFSTEAERKEAIRIATEEKLAAMIRDFEGVRDAQVNISLGTDRYYVLQDDTTPSTAAVKITPEGNQQLSSGVVEAIRFMVSHSVEKLNISDVSIVDTLGNVYTDSSTGIGAMSDATALQRQYEQQTNNQVRTQVLQVLEPIYGPGNVTVGVNTTVDMDRRMVESTEYSQPEGSVEGGGLIGKEQWYWATGGDGNFQIGGTVGAGPNSDVITYPDIEGDLGNGENGAAASGNRDHNVNTTVTQREVLAGKITDVNVSVSINQNAQNATALSIEDLSEHIATASGIGTELENWGSHVSVKIAPFADTEPFTPANPNPPSIIPGVDNWVVLAAIAGVVLFLILLVLILLLRRRRKKKKLAAQLAAEAELREAEEAAAAEAAAAAIIAAAPTGGADIMEVNTEKSMELRKTVRQFAQNNPEIAAQMVKAWLKGEENGG